jgi:hypothetical protein
MTLSAYGGNRRFMLKWSAAKQAILLSPQSSALSPFSPDTRHLKPYSMINED